ncbi:MAG TPA: hypothetical protein VNL18_06190 [Gemmatimonadales bacterium]|nr:hypothetical protein [Gemmatimonadales bacterium]
MPANPLRYGALNPAEPAVHELPPIRYGTSLVPVRVEVRRSEDGTWRGRLLFGAVADDPLVATGEILYGATDGDFWESVRDLRDHHLRDLYRSLIE